MLHSNRSRSPYEDGTKPDTVQAGQAALVAVGCFFLGFLVGFLIAG
jgi:hypothetical protein